MGGGGARKEGAELFKREEVGRATCDAMGTGGMPEI